MVSLNKKMRHMFLQQNSVYARLITRRVIIAIVFFSVLMLILAADFLPEKVSLQLGQVSDHDVVVPRTISYINEARTKKLEAEVLSSIANIFDLDVTVLNHAEEQITEIFRSAHSVALDNKLVTVDQKIEKLEKNSPVSLLKSVVVSLTNLDESSLIKAEEQVCTIIRKFLQRGIREDDLEFTRKNIVIEVGELKLAHDTENVVSGIAQLLMQPNFVLNVRETEKRKQAAIANVEPVRETVKKGQVLVRRGDVVSEEQIRIMEELGMYASQLNELRLVGLTIFVFVIAGIVLGYLYKFSKSVYKNNVHLLLISLITIIILLLGKVAHYYNDFAAPAAMGALITAILINPRVGIIFSIAISMLLGVIVDHDLRVVTTTLIGCIIGVYSISKTNHGYSLTKSGVWIAGINVLIIGATGFIEQLNLTQVLMQSITGAVSGVASAVITIGLLPYLEHAFNIITPLSLLEFIKPNHQLLQRLLIDAPGTYHHSIVVGNIAETAAGAIGADPIIVRVGAYYHDIGKIKRPYFFIENQVASENPHDKIAPSLSTLIVTSHIKDGVDLCRDYKLPQVIIDVVQQHHGTTLVSYFYKRATENEHSECIIEADFRYEGPRPQTKEAALIMLADSCEAAVRSISKPNINRIETTVRKIIRERLHDGQLDECNLTLKDLNIVGDIFIQLLSSMFHTRIEYPDAVKELERRKPKNGSNNKQPAVKDNAD